ncbi:MAG: ECF transporter S component [Erysipelotrichia bacterium]|nr:ECF transporter S component [Erysipelotrichia bacterium]NCC55522.1 ECF transporter S component [Erysipelotrichia bacterium]
MKNSKVQLLCKCAMMGALAAIVMLLEFAIPLVPPFYELDFSEVIILLTGFALGPLAAFISEAIKIILNLLLNGSTTMGVGEFANFLMGLSFVLPATFYYRKHKTKKDALYGMVISTIILCICAAILNYFVLLPAYAYFMNLPMDTLIQIGTAANSHITNLFTLIIIAVVPFNLLKGILTSLIVMLTYKKVSPILKK